MNRPLVIDDAARIVTPTETAISPDGTQVVYVRSATANGSPTSELWSVTDAEKPKRLTSGPHDMAPRWNADGSELLFLRFVDGASQLFTLRAGGGEAEQLTTAKDLPLGAGAGVYSPDAKSVAFTAAVQINTHPGASPAPLVVDSIGYKFDGAGWLGDTRVHLFVVDRESKTVRRLTDGRWNASGPVWSPDSNKLAFTSDAESGSGTSLASSAYTIVVDRPGSRPTRFGHAHGIDAVVLWLDADEVVAVGNEYRQAGDADLLKLSTGKEDDANLTSGLDRSVMLGAPGYPGGRPAIDGTGKDILFCLRDRGWTHLYTIPLKGGSARGLITGANRVVSSLSVAAAAPKAAVVLTTQESFGEVAVVDLNSGELSVLTELGKEALPDVDLYVTEEREFAISDGFTVHGWLLSAPETTGAAPLLLDVHGGPHNAWSGVADGAHLYQQELVARGWRVLMLNPRGSDGYGKEFMRAVVGGWGVSDTKDFLEPIDALIEEGLVDGDRLAVTGYSYGGFTTCSLTTQTERFSAAIAGGLICNFASLQGTCDMGNFITEIGLTDEAAADYVSMTAASPIALAHKVNTPTLILQGQADQRCPIGQAEEWFAALSTRGVPSRMVAYPGASHIFLLNGDLEHRLDYNHRVVDWALRYTRKEKPAVAGAPASRDVNYWQRRLDTLRERYGVVGAQFGILELADLEADGGGGRLNTTLVSSGVLNVDSRVPVTNDSTFQIGSITKVWTTILVMQLIDEGLLELDTKVRTVLPNFALADEYAAANVTVRHLLNHTSGIDGDLFLDMGRGDDCVELYVDALSSAVNIHPLGERFSYCNAGFVVAGRIVEVLRNVSWDTALKEQIFEPLGLTHTFTLSDDAPRFQTATGHFGLSPNAVATTTWPLTRGMGPAGLISSRVSDVLVFAEAALRGGALPGGKRILSEEGAKRMLEEEIDLRNILPGHTGWGLGWFLEEWSGKFVYGHDGSTLGQKGFLRIFPDDGFALALGVSGGQADGLRKELFDDAAQSIAGLSSGAGIAPNPEASTRVSTDELGVYESGGILVEIASDDNGPILRTREKGDLKRDGEEAAWETVPLEVMDTQGIFGVTTPMQAGWTQIRPVQGGAYVGYRYVPRKQQA